MSIVDSTVVVASDSNKGDYRVHLKLDLSRMRLEKVEVTSCKEAESLSRYEYETGELVLGDRNFSKANELVNLDKSGVYMLVRSYPAQLKMYDSAGEGIKWGEYDALCR